MMISPIKPEEIHEFATAWFRALDVHAPIDQCWSMLSDDHLHMHFPDGEIQDFVTFKKWYDRVTNLFFDEKHAIRKLEVQSATEDLADVTVVVGWKASWWKAPAAESQHINLEATQRWTIRACPTTKNVFGLEICTYIIDNLEYAPDSARLPPLDTGPNKNLIALNEETQADLDGQEMYEMLFGKPAKVPLIGLREFTIRHLFAHVWRRSRPPIDEARMISLKERSMITVALLAAQGRSEELESHIRGALHQGITKEQVLEIMIHVAHYAGWPAGHNGQRVAMKIFEWQADT